MANQYLYMSRAEIKAKLDDPNTVALELVVATIVIKSIQAGDQQRLTFLLDRLIGPVKHAVEHSGPNEGPIRITDDMTEAELDRRAHNILKRLQDRFKDEAE